MPPPRLAPELQRLPPILHNPYQSSTSSCSKGPRGLSVLVQLTSIFTRTSISPGLWLRQRGSRYAIRAGRNLPDKEFRSSNPHVAMGLGPYLHLTGRDEMTGVWPLRIQGIATAAADSSSARCVRSVTGLPKSGGSCHASYAPRVQTSRNRQLSP